MGGAAVGNASAGRATPARAAVRAGASAEPDGAGGSAGAGDSAGRARHGRGSRASLDPEAAKRLRRRKIANWSIATFAVVIMAAGVGLVGITYMLDDVGDINTFVPEASAVLYADGTELTTLGDQNRTVVPRDKISKVVKDAVVSAEDTKFYDHTGIDMKGIARAAWNNLSGGDTQGASTITQQYARDAAKLQGMNYNRKIREALLARKIESNYSKDEILSFYLNAIYFGRGAYGIEAAAKAYFNKSVMTPPGQEGAITASEAAVLASVIKQPEPSKTHPGFDPHYDLAEAKGRWGYTLGNMVELGFLTTQQQAEAVYPESTLVPYDPDGCQAQCAGTKPIGHVLAYVKQELKQIGITDWRKVPYKITISINPTMQRLAEQAASRTSAKSPMSKLAENHQAALVAVDPSNGRVLAYYGGDDGSGFDYAGRNGGHPPGSTFKMYTLAAGLREGMSMDSYWDATKTEDETRGREISDAGREVPSCRQYCSLAEMTKQSRNTAFYWMTEAMGPDKVVAAARDAGVRSMWTDEDEEIILPDVDPKKVSPSEFDLEVGFGQYKVRVIEHVNGLATLANRGTYHQAHFVVGVERKDTGTGEWEKVNGERLKPDERFEAEQIDSMLKVLQEVPAFSEVNAHDLAGGRPAFAKSGTWELGRGNDPSANGDAWYMGATPQVATGVWVGTKGDRQALKEANGKSMFGGGAPGQIWEDFMNSVHKELKLPSKTFPAGPVVGDPTLLANGVSPAPKAPPGPKPGNPGSPAGCAPSDIECLLGGGNPGGNPGGGNPGGGAPGGGNPGGGNPGGPSRPPSAPPSSEPPAGPGEDD